MGGGNIYEQQGAKTYRTMGRWDTFMVFASAQLGLATVTLPSILLTIGIVPGLLAIIGSDLRSWYCLEVRPWCYQGHVRHE